MDSGAEQEDRVFPTSVADITTARKTSVDYRSFEIEEEVTLLAALD